MSKIPEEILSQMEDLKFYKFCCLTGCYCETEKVDRHHNLTFGGPNVQELFCILPIRKRGLHKYHEGITKEVKELLNWIMLNRMSDVELVYYSKAINRIHEKYRLNKKYGIWKEGFYPLKGIIN